MFSSIVDKIRDIFINRYVQSFIRTFGLWLGTLLTSAGVDPALIERFTADSVSVASVVVPYLIVQALSWINAKKSK